MANLLEKSSIVLTPTAYDNGKLLCVKPSDGSGDFDFSRNSSATRVNAQGLVEDVQILSGDLVQNGDFSEISTEKVLNGDFSEIGAEEVSNGDFSNGSTDWTLGTGWSIGDDIASCDGTQTGNTNLSQPLTWENTNYLQTIEVIVTAGTLLIYGGNSNSSITITSSGTYEFYTSIILSGNVNDIYIQGDLNFIGSVTNISVKEVGQNWGFTSGAFLTDIGARITHTPTAGILTSEGYSALVVGKNYKMTYEITQSISGGIKLNSAVVNTMFSTVGVHTKYFEAGAVSISFARTDNIANDVTIDNISVKEVGQNWSFGDGFTPDQVNSKATCDGTQTAATNLQQTITTNIQNQLVRVSFTLDYTAGLLLGSLSGTGAVDFNNITSSGTYTAEMTSNEVSPILTLQGDASFIGSITNVIIKSVTNDTNLPRINYEGFSYDGSGNIVPNSGCGSWLFEPQSTNLIPYSEDFSQWNPMGSPTITSNFGTSPDGTQNADRVQMNIGDRLFESSSTPNVSFSVYAKSNSGLTHTISMRDGGGVVTYDMVITDEWQRFDVYLNTTMSNVQFRAFEDNIDVLFWGAMVEAQSYATSYIPTEGTTKTRNQDLCTNGGDVSLISSTEGVLYAEINTLNQTGTFRQINLSNGTASSRIYISKRADNDLLEFRMENSLGSLNFGFNLDTTSNFVKVAFRYGVNNFAVFINGVNKNVSPTGNTFSFGTLNKLDFSSPLNQPFFGKTKCLAVWKESLSDTELTELTTI